MGRASAKLRSFCLSGVATRIRLRPATAAAAAATAATAATAAEAAAAEAATAGVGEKPDSCQSLALACGDDDGEAKEEDTAGDKKDDRGGETKAEAEARVVMVVVDRSPEAKTALQWALSHAVQSHDCLLLLDVVNPAKSDRQCERERDPKDYQLLYAMKSICQAKRPEVHVEVCLVEGQDRGPTIVEEAGRRHVSLLVVGGPRRRSPALTWRLLVMWVLGADFSGGGAAARIGSSVADYCIQHAACAALAVRRKGRGGGGYLLTTKRRKDFWLLA